LVQILQSIVDERKALLKNGKIEEKKDLLDILLDINDEKGEKLEVDDIIDFLIALLLSGHETLATTMMWLITYLTEHPLCLKKAKVNNLLFFMTICTFNDIYHHRLFFYHHIIIKKKL